MALPTTLLIASLLGATAGSGRPLVAIDPGHGGELDGAVGICGAKEKDVTLAISLELASLLYGSEPRHARQLAEGAIQDLESCL